MFSNLMDLHISKAVPKRDFRTLVAELYEIASRK
jgi:hypothetical protein